MRFLIYFDQNDQSAIFSHLKMLLEGSGDVHSFMNASPFFVLRMEPAGWFWDILSTQYQQLQHVIYSRRVL